MKKKTLKRTKNINRRALYTLRLSFTATILVMAIFLCTSCGMSAQTEPTESVIDGEPTESVIDVEPTETEESKMTLPPKEDEPEDLDPELYSDFALALAEYPVMSKYSDGYSEWSADRKKQLQYHGAGKDLDEFFNVTVKEFLLDSDGENLVYSPMNVYMALSMLAEITGGDSRKQILDLLGVENIEALRIQVNSIWNANYFDDGMVTSIIANSLWMNENDTFEQECLDRLNSDYHTSLFEGDPTDAAYSEALRAWLNHQTGGELDSIQGIKMDPLMLMTLASTLYFEAQWNKSFSKENNTVEVFHSPSGDIPCEYMNRDYDEMEYYWGEKFTAIQKSLDYSGDMWFILPDEGSTVDDLLADEETLSFIDQGSSWEKNNRYWVSISMPKFSVESNMDLYDKLIKLGVTDCFGENADFSPITDREDAFISKVQHGAGVTVNEKGVVGAAYTVINWYGGMPQYEKIEFTLDRPFIFIIKGSDGIPLFAGVVNQP